MKQPALFEDVAVKEWEEHWKEMPDFFQPQKDCYAQVIVRFRNQHDLDDFAKKIDQKLTPKSQSTWHPELLIGVGPVKRWVYEP